MENSSWKIDLSLVKCEIMDVRSFFTTYQNNGKFLLQLGGVRHGDLQRHDVMLHLRLAIHTFYVAHSYHCSTISSTQKSQPSLSFTDPKNFTNGWIQIIHFPKPRWKADSAEGSFYCPKMPFTHAFKVYSELHCSSPSKPTFKSNNKKTAAFSSIKSFCSLPDQSIPHHRFPPATDSTHIPSTAFF